MISATPLHAHFWLLEPRYAGDGGLSRGVCRVCLAERTFDNDADERRDWISTAQHEYRQAAALKGARATAAVRRKGP